MNGMFFRFPEKVKNITRFFGGLFDSRSLGLLVGCLVIWYALSNSIGIIFPISTHLIGGALTISAQILYNVVIPDTLYNKFGGERLYKLALVKLRDVNEFHQMRK